MITSSAIAVLPETLTDRAGALSAEIAERLRTPPPPQRDRDRGPASPRWHAQSLSKGAAGVALLHGLRARAGLGSAEPVHAWLAATTREPLSAGGGAGLWYGATAVAFSLHETAPGRYQRALHQLDQAVTKLVHIRLDAAHARINAGQRPSLREYDLVRGLTGLGAYLLRRAPEGQLLRQILTYLVRLTRPVPAPDELGTGVPGWWTGDAPSGWDPHTCGGGHTDLGTAHGIAGPLALLSLALRAGIAVDRQINAIDRIAGWLETWRQEGPTGPWWPERVTSDDQRARGPVRPGPNRPSWCYGTPGITRAMQLAALATGDRARQQRAEHALLCCLSDPVQLARLTDPALCHGWAGIFTTAWHAATDARTGILAEYLPHLLQAVLDTVPGSPDEPIGLIEGSAGVAAALHLAATGTSGWETCLLIS